jgi:hypothetical protein
MNSNKIAPNFGLANPFLSTPPGPANGLAFLTTKNPFAEESAIDEVPANAPEGSYAYALVKSGPDVPAEECEVPVTSVEVMVRWGSTVLHVAHLTPPRSFYVGEDQGKDARSDCFVPSEKLGATRAPIVLVDKSGSLSAVLLPNASGSIEIAGEKAMSIRQAIEGGRAVPCAEVSGAHQIALPQGAKAKLEIEGFTFEVSTVNAGRQVAGRLNVNTQSLPYHGVSMALHVGLLAAMAFFMPPLSATDEGSISAEQQSVIRTKLDAIAERDLAAQKEAESVAADQPTDTQGGTGARAKGGEGAMGSMTSSNKGGRFGIEGPKSNTDIQAAKSAALRDASTFGVIGLLAAGGGGDPNAPTVPWGGDVSLGNDARSALGNMWGSSIDEAAGANGLGLSGVGEGGGGKFEGIGLGEVGTIGHGRGIGTDQGFGPGSGSSFGKPRGAHKAEPPRVRNVGTSVSGRIPPEVIQRIVRQNFGRFRLCYENGLRNNPSLQGRVGVRFVIDRNGAVTSVGNGGSDLPDSAVTSCVIRAFYGLSFPPPDEGIVTVTYPIMFTPGS